MEEKKNVAPLVVKLSGKALGAEKELERLCRELKSAGRAFLLVHGGGVAVDRLMADLGIEVRRVRGLRVSPAEEMPLIAGSLAGTCSLALRSAAVRAGLLPLGRAVTDGGMCTVLPEDPELGRVAKTAPGNEEARSRLLSLLDAGWLPVISSVGLDAEGRLWNINADDAALSIAELLGAPLIFLSDVRGVLDGDKRLIPELTPESTEVLVRDGVITAGMVVKMNAAFAASRAIGAPVSIASIFDDAVPRLLSEGKFPGTVCRV